MRTRPELASLKQALIAVVILGLLAVNFFEFHDLFEHKTIPEYMTGILSVPILLLLLDQFLSAKRA